MGLLDNLKNRGQGDGQAAPAGDGSQKSLDQWLKDSQTEWDKCDANAPDTSQTTAETVYKLLQEHLPLNEEAAIQRMGMLLLSWRAKSPLAMSVCRSCGYHFQVLGSISEATLPTTCKECQDAMVRGTIFYSKEVGRIARNFLASHARCIQAINQMLASIQGGKPDMQQFYNQYENALDVAKQEGHGKAASTAVRTNLAVQLAYARAIAEAGVQSVTQSNAPAGGAQEATLKSSLESLQFMSQLARAAMAAQETKIGIQAYGQATSLRAILVARTPKDAALCMDQAVDLDELGMALREHEPQRRPEALRLVRQAKQLLDALDHNDPSGSPSRAKASLEVTSHLNLEW